MYIVVRFTAALFQNQLVLLWTPYPNKKRSHPVVSGFSFHIIYNFIELHSALPLSMLLHGTTSAPPVSQLSLIHI